MLSQQNEQILKQLNKSDLTKYENLELMFQTARNVLTIDGELEESLKICQGVKQNAAAMATKDVRCFDLYNKCLLFRAPYYFDDYLLYIEKDRDVKARFYLPRRKQFIKLGLIQALQELETGDLETLSLSLPPGTGKAQPLYSKVLTPNGFINMGDIKFGTKVISGTGNTCNVVGVYPQGVKPIYELTFDDGSTCRCSDEHLWRVQTRDDRNTRNKDGSERYRTITLNKMLKNYKVENGKRCNYSIDNVPLIDFEKKELTIHPYVLGVLIGDGSLQRAARFTNEEPDIVDRVRGLLSENEKLTCTGKKQNFYSIVSVNELRNEKGFIQKQGTLKALSDYGLIGKGTHEKYIPSDYLNSCLENRIELLRGLFDTDGYVSHGNSIEYSTTSEQLKDDILYLVRSLGGYASFTVKQGNYRKNGEKIIVKTYYRLVIQFPNTLIPVSSKKHLAKYNVKRNKIKRYITNIEYIGEEECQCIMIDDESHLYITDNFIITHNTTLGEFFISWVVGRHPEDYNLFVSHSGDITRMFYDAINNITSSGEYLWHDVFPTVQKESENAKIEQINFGKFKPFKSIQCTSVGSKNAGKVRCNGYLYCDDLIGGIEEALSKPRLDKLWTTYSVDLRQRKKDGCKEIHVATRWSVHDVIGRLQMKFGKSDKARFIAIPDIDPDTDKSNFDYDYGVGYSEDYFHDQEDTMDDISYKCLYKSEPIEREGLLYHEDDIRRYVTLPLQQPDAILGICDTKDKGTDFLFLPVMLQYGEDYYCVDCVCDDNSDYGVQYQNCAKIILDNKMQQCQFESNNGGSRVGYEVNKLVEEGGGRCNITSQVTTSNKETKIIVNADWVKKHVLFKDDSLYKPKDQYGVMMSFLLSYSVKGKNTHDDVPDGLAQFALFVTNMYGTKATIVDRRSLGI